jgi:hypothetical protein
VGRFHVFSYSGLSDLSRSPRLIDG